MFIKSRSTALIVVSLLLLSCSGGGGDGTPVNTPPTVSAGKDQEISVGLAQRPEGSITVTLTGQGSDPDGGSLDYLWTQIDGTRVTLTDAGQPTASFVLPEISVSMGEQVLTFRLTVTDSEGSSASDTVIVRVIEVNEAPIANAGADQTVEEKTLVSLPGLWSDSDGSIVGFGWKQTVGKTVILKNEATETASFIAPDVTNGTQTTLEFEFTVTDNEGGTHSDSLSIEVYAAGNAPNNAPTVDAGADQHVAAGTRVDLAGSGSDIDGSIAGFNWTQTLDNAVSNAVTLTNEQTANAWFTAPNVTSGTQTLIFEFTVTDDQGESMSDSLSIVVHPAGSTPNNAPIVDAGADQNVGAGASVTLSGSGSDSDGSIAGYAWKQIGSASVASVTLENDATANARFTAPNVSGGTQTLHFEFTITDDDGESASDILSIVVHPANTITPNNRPTVEAGADQNVEAGSQVSLSGSGSDQDGRITTRAWKMTGGSPAVTLSGAGTADASFTAPAVTNDPQTLIFEFTITDDDGADASDTLSIVVYPASTTENNAPIVDAGSDQDVNAQTPVYLFGKASDSDGRIVTRAWKRTDNGSSTITLIGEDAANASFTAPAVDSGTQTLIFEFEVTDDKGASARDTLSIVVYPGVSAPNTAPVANAGDERDVDEKTSVTLDGSGSTDSDGSIASYAWSQIDGDTVTLTDADTDTASFTAPTVIGEAKTLTFQLTVTDNEGDTATDTIVITVNAVNALPTAAAGDDQTVNEQTSVTLNGNDSGDSDGSIASYAWSQIDGDTVTLTDADTDTASFTAPTVIGEAKTLTFELTVTDNEGDTATDTIVITVNAVNALPTAAAGDDQTVNEQTSVTLNGNDSGDSDGSIASYAWSQIDGDTVTLTDADTDTASFTAPTVVGEAKTLTFQLTVTDNEGDTATDTIVITVNAVNALPTAAAGDDQTVDEQTGVTLDGNDSGDSDGSIASYAWSQIDGDTVTLTDADTDTASFTAPTVIGEAKTLTFQLTVTDNEGDTATDTIVITVNAVNALPTAAAGDDQTVDEQTGVTLDGNDSGDSDGSIASYAWSQIDGDTVTLTDADTDTASFTAPTVIGEAKTLTFQLTLTDNEGDTATDTIVITVNAVNALPTAAAGDDQTVNEQTSVTLNGNDSGDSDGSIVSYAWSQIDGDTVTLTDADTDTASFTAPTVIGEAKTLTFQLTVTDNEGDTATDTIVITVNAVNAAPTAAAGDDQTVNEQTSVTLNGNDSGDSDGSIASYAWSQIDGDTVTLTDADTDTASFTAPTVIGEAKTLTFQLTVTDNEGDTATDTIVITVNAVNAAPTAAAGDDQTVDEQTGVTLDGSDSADTDGSIVSYAWSQIAGPSVTLSNPSAVSPTFDAPVVLANAASDVPLLSVSPTFDPTIVPENTSIPFFLVVTFETLTFTLVVTDNEGAIHSDTVDIRVIPRNRLPTAAAGDDQTVNEQTSVTLNGSNSGDSDGSIASYAWSQIDGDTVTLTDADTDTASFTAPTVIGEARTLTFELAVTDNEGDAATDRVIVKVVAVDDPPIANAGDYQSVKEKTNVTLDGSQSSDDSGIDGYQWVQIKSETDTTPVPTSHADYVVLTDADQDKASFTAPVVLQPDSPLNLFFQLTVTDDATSAQNHSDITRVSIEADNNAPTADAGVDLPETDEPEVEELSVVRLSGKGDDSDGEVVSYQWTQIVSEYDTTLVTGTNQVIIKDDGTAKPSFTAPAVSVADGSLELTFQLTVTDNEGATATDTMVVTVTPYRYHYQFGSPNLFTPRTNHAAARLKDGMVLLTGGTQSGDTATLYDPVSGSFTDLVDDNGNKIKMVGGIRTMHTSTSLENGDVLIIGGWVTSNATMRASSELYDFKTRRFKHIGSSMKGRLGQHQATRLPNGKVLITGGARDSGGTPIKDAELYDPVQDVFTVAASMTRARRFHSASLLENGNVLITGDYGREKALSGTAELYKFNDEPPLFEAFPPGRTMKLRRANHESTTLYDGRVLITGGHHNGSDNTADSSEVYDPDGNFDDHDDDLSVQRLGLTSTLLNDGRVLIVGGESPGVNTAQTTAERYDPETAKFTPIRAATEFPRLSHGAVKLADGKVLIFGGNNNARTEIYDPASGNWTTLDALPALDRLKYSTATLLDNDKVLITGGDLDSNSRAIAKAGIYDPERHTFTPISDLNVARLHHKAVKLKNGKVLISGGGTNTSTHGTHNYIKSVELYDPDGMTFTLLSDMNQARGQHTMTLLDNDKVLITGGFYNSGYIRSTELYDPSGNGSSMAGNDMTMIRARHTANKLNNGKVVLIGGFNGSNYTRTAELYDPDTGELTRLGNNALMGSGLGLHSATLLDNHSILIVGGRIANTDNTGINVIRYFY